MSSREKGEGGGEESSLAEPVEECPEELCIFVDSNVLTRYLEYHSVTLQ